ncbi:MAG: mechanosensitive ion channel domain-containing protein [Flavobacteriaceae bacterium]
MLLIALIPLTAASQGDPVETVQDTSDVDKPQAISVINVVSEMERIVQEIGDAKNQIRPRKNLVSIDSLYPDYEVLIEEREVLARDFLEANPSRQEVDNMILKWRGNRSYLRSWLTSINAYLNRNSILDAQISSKKVIWDLTYTNAEQKEAPQRILENIEEIRGEISEVRTEIGLQNTRFLKLESQINDQIALVNSVIGDLEVMRESEIFNLFYLRGKPLWKGQEPGEGPARDRSYGVETVSENIATIKELLRSSENKLYLYVLLVLFLTGLVLLVRQAYIRVEYHATTRSIGYARDVMVKKPYLIIYFLSVLVLQLIFSGVPRLFGDSILLLILVGAALIIGPFVHKKFRFVPYWIIFLVFIHSLRSFIGISTIQFRFYMLFEAFLMIGLLIYYVYPYNQTRQMPFGMISRLLLRLTPVLFVLLLVTVIANILGYTNLAVFALKVAFQGTDMSLSFSALLLVAQGLIIGLIHHRFSRKTMVDSTQRSILETKVNRIIHLVVGFGWIYYFLVLVDLYRPIYETTDQFLSIPYKVGSITFTLGMLVTFVGILAISFAITSLISFLLDGKEVRMSFISLPKGIPSAISLVIRYFILAVGFVLALSSLGIDLSKFNLMAGALGLGIGFGLQTVVSNFISGIILVFDRPILPGDVVEVNNLLGKVNKIGVRASRISTFDGAEVVVPNNNLISNDLINWTLSNNIRRLEILVGTSYKADPNLVLQAMREVTADHPLVLKYPAPIPLFLEFGESSLNFRLLFWINIQNVLSARSEVSIALYNRFKELGIKIPYPQRVVHLPESDPDNVHPQDE